MGLICLLLISRASNGWADSWDIVLQKGITSEEADDFVSGLSEAKLIFLDEKRRYIWPIDFAELGIYGELKKQDNRYLVHLNYDLAHILHYIEDFYAQYLDEAQDAYFQISYDDKVTIVPEKDGQKLALEPIASQIVQALQYPCRQQVILLQSHWLYPVVTAQDLAKLEINGLLGEFTTRFAAGDTARVNNIWLASSKINDYILQPGETFSFNETVGPRTKERGFAEAGVIRNKQHEVDVGGGVCQTATTLYNAARAAKLTIIERHGHSLPVRYVAKGCDAAVVYGEKDLRFRNDTQHAILIRSYFAYGKLLFKIYGHVA